MVTNFNTNEFSISLRAAARCLGIQTSYLNNEGASIKAPERTLIKLCAELSGISPDTVDAAKSILNLKHKELLAAKMPKSIVAWGGRLRPFYLQLPYVFKSENLRFKLNDTILDFKILTTVKRKDRQTLQIQITNELNKGYSEIFLLLNEKIVAASFVISAAEKLPPQTGHEWGPFIPIYALRSDADWGIGSFTELAQAAKICKNSGASFISVLPTLAGNFDFEDCDPSPYSALSRFFWNEIYLDVDELLVKYPVAAAIKIRNSPEFQAQLAELRSTDYVNYFRSYQLKKKLLLILSNEFFSKPLPVNYVDFLANNPLIERYVTYRSSDSNEHKFHLFVQFETDQVLAGFQQNFGLKLYMDYPVGVNDSGFDFKNDSSDFLASVSVGAPPEPVFQLGQDWGFPAFHPKTLREKHYTYFIESIRQHLKYSKILRLDHVIGLYRIYSVPKTYGGKNGAYIRFTGEDFFAIAVLEAEMAAADVIGENLGTVPEEVNEILRERNLKSMQILQLDLHFDPAVLAEKLDQNVLCALNTHDMPMFARFLKGEDLTEVQALGILSAAHFSVMQKEREEQLTKWAKIFQQYPVIGALRYLSASKCRYLVVNVEDFWGEEQPQNIPGTWKEVPNWRRKMRIKVSEWESNEGARQALALLKEHFPLSKNQ